MVIFYRGILFQGRTFLVEGGVNETMPLSEFSQAGAYGYSGPLNEYELDKAAKAWAGQPFDRYSAESYQAGEIPLWNPYEGIGMPFHANGQSAILDPIHALIYLFPLNRWPLAEDLHLLLRYFLAGLFTVLFLRSLGANIVASL